MDEKAIEEILRIYSLDTILEAAEVARQRRQEGHVAALNDMDQKELLAAWRASKWGSSTVRLEVPR